MANGPRRRPTSGAGLTSLMVACQQGLDIDVRNLIARKPDSLILRDRSGKNALHYCAENTHTNCAEQIVYWCPRLLDEQDDEGYSPLHLAVISGNGVIVRFLLDCGADVSCVDNEKHTCVHWATVCGEVDCLDMLTEAGGNPSTPDIHGAYPIHYAAQMCGPNSEMGNRVEVGLMVLKKLLSKGVDVNCEDKDGRQPLLWAASAETRASKTYCPSGSSDAILTLVKAGADVTAQDKDGLTALHCSASRGHLDCLETLITLCGSEADALDSNGCSPLFYAVTLGHADCTHLLLGHRALPNLQDRKGRTAAHCGASKGQFETLRILRQHRANLWLRNSKGDTPLHEAVQSGRKDLVQWFLEQLEGSVNVTNVNGRTPLHIAAITNNVELCKVLMDHGAFINPIMKNSKGHFLTPLDAALYRGNRSCAKYLQLHGALPSTKLVEKVEVYRSEVSPDQSVSSPELRHRIYKESAVQTENVRKDADVQVHWKRDVRNENEMDKVLGSLGSRERTSKESRKPIVAKVYVHTKRRDRRPLRRTLDESKKKTHSLQREDSKYQKRQIPRFTNSTTSHTIKSQTPPKDTTDTNIQDISERLDDVALVSEASIKVPMEETTEEMPDMEENIEPVVTPSKSNCLCGCCADPYEDEASLQSSCICECHKRVLSSHKSDVEDGTEVEPTETPYHPAIPEVKKQSSEEYQPDEEAEQIQEEAVVEKDTKRLPVDFDDLSPLSSLRSIESNVKDSGFSEDLERGDMSSETDGPLSSPKNHSRGKPVARFVVTSGAADAYPLEEDEEDTEERFSLRSASLPTLHPMGRRDKRRDNGQRILGRLALTKEVQKTLRRYQLERRLFYELQELKRKQICGGTLDGEATTVLKMVERFRRYVFCPGMSDFRGPLTFYAFEKYLYEQLRKLSTNFKVPKQRTPVTFPTRPFADANEGSPSEGLCICKTHMCHHIRRTGRKGSVNKSLDKEPSRDVILPEIEPARRTSSQSFGRASSWDRMGNHRIQDAQTLTDPPFRMDLSKSLPTLPALIPRRIPSTLLSAISERLGPDVHPDDTVVVELSSDGDETKVRHAFSVREIWDAVRQWEETSGRTLKPLRLERVLDNEHGPVTFEIRHGNERNVFRLPSDKLKGDKKWFLHYCLWPVGRYLYPTEDQNFEFLVEDDVDVRREVICLSTSILLQLPNFRIL